MLPPISEFGVRTDMAAGVQVGLSFALEKGGEDVIKNEHQCESVGVRLFALLRF
jgi:hypothetical protein